MGLSFDTLRFLNWSLEPDTREILDIVAPLHHPCLFGAEGLTLSSAPLTLDRAHSSQSSQLSLLRATENSCGIRNAVSRGWDKAKHFYSRQVDRKRTLRCELMRCLCFFVRVSVRAWDWCLCATPWVPNQTRHRTKLVYNSTLHSC